MEDDCGPVLDLISGSSVRPGRHLLRLQDKLHGLFFWKPGKTEGMSESVQFLHEDWVLEQCVEQRGPYGNQRVALKISIRSQVNL